MNKLIDNKFTNLYLNAAVSLGLKYEILDEKTAYVKIYNDLNQIMIVGNVLDLNREINARIAANKKKTSQLLNKEGIPVPKFASFKINNLQKAYEYVSKKVDLDFHIVVKPLTGEGAFGITVNPSTASVAEEAINEAFSVNREILIEEFIKGDNFRITLFDSEIIAVTQRTPGFVVSDGKNSVADLIKKKNNKRRKIGLPSIFLRKKDLEFLASHDIHLSSVFAKGKKICLQQGCDLDIGGERRKISINSIPQENKDMFKEAASIIGLRLTGIDFITPDITKSYRENKCAINEMNSCPSFDVHYLDQFPNNNYAAERLLEKYFQIPEITDKVFNTPSRKLPLEDKISQSVLSSGNIKN